MVGQRFRMDFCFQQGTQFWMNSIYTVVTASRFGGDDSFNVGDAWDSKYRSFIGNLVGHSVHYRGWFIQDMDNPSLSFLRQLDIVNPFNFDTLPIFMSLYFSFPSIAGTRRKHIQFWAGFDQVFFQNGDVKPFARTLLNGQAWLNQPRVSTFTISANLCLWERPRPSLPLGRMTACRAGKVGHLTTNTLRTRHNNAAVMAHFGY